MLRFKWLKLKLLQKLTRLCQLLLKNMDRDNLKGTYLAVSLDRRYSVVWITCMKQLLRLCCVQLRAMTRANQSGKERMDLYLNFLVLFTDYTLWRFTAKLSDSVKRSMHLLCTKFVEHLYKRCSYFSAMHSLLANFLRSSYVTGQSLTAMFGFRQLAMYQLSPTMLVDFAVTLLTVPGCVFVLQKKAPESIQKLQKISFALHLLKAITVVAGKDPLVSLGVKPALSLFGNVINVCQMHIEEIKASEETSLMLDVFTVLTSVCDSSRLSKGSNASSWHPFFGWIKADIDRRNVEGLSLIQKQFQLLWNGPMVEMIVGTPLLRVSNSLSSKGKRVSIFRKQTILKKLNDSEFSMLKSGCELYLNCLSTFPLLSTDILIGLSCNGDVISQIWHALSDMSCLKEDLAFKVLTELSSQQTSLKTVLTLAIQATQYLIATLDDEELHTKQQYFTLDDLKDISTFLKHLVYKFIMEVQLPSMFSHCHALLTLLHSRDCRRSFTSDPNFWTEKKLRAGLVIKDLKLGKTYALNLLKYMPFCVPFKNRIDVFMESINADKECLGLLEKSHRRPATYITIRRGRVLEGGYDQLSSQPVTAIKGTIRVKFVNEQGLDEAGIDEAGVFKEFLEEFISVAFDPSLGLFKISSSGLLYPSPSSSVQENHLALFEFIGRILGKAVYEGIVVDVQFAQFFLSQILEHHLSSLYSSLDELVYLDSDVYKSLSYIKHADSGIEDLCLTFTWEENLLGKTITHELLLGGSLMEVTAENKISYVHRMAHFMLYTQLKQQSIAFLKGFHSVISPSWIGTFSPTELQSIISGEQVDFDVDDLRQHTEYFGGYHSKHQVIIWLWEILRNDLDKERKKSFLKFVTSCSRPPLLGFSQLKPRFGIRCVDIRDAEGTRESLGSVMKGFFSIRSPHSSEKLPSASTCFNLLKLPNYRKKAILREKLIYAISAHAGFELS
ncbi:ubiquitin-protein ligase E3B-like isoform X2 [Halichondria panicea]|uniref:ubiquitin-protein ligase E3B-like isoform X2 n=1 Tax=Halichondria panicea TaxID=6063 RepID=UPI00312BC620